jgi:hypothetical protein
MSSEHVRLTGRVLGCMAGAVLIAVALLGICALIVWNT